MRSRCGEVSALRQRLSVATTGDERERIRTGLRAIAGDEKDLASAFAKIVLATLARLEGEPSAAARILEGCEVAAAAGPADLRDVVLAQEAIERVQTWIVLGNEERATEIAREVLVLARRLGGQWPLSACTAYAEAMSARGKQEQVEAFLSEVLAAERGVEGSALLCTHLEARLAIAQSSTWCDAAHGKGRDLAELAARLGKLAAEPALAGLRGSLVRRRIHVCLEAGETRLACELAGRELAAVSSSPREVLRFTGFRARGVLLGAAKPGGADLQAGFATERDALAAALRAFLAQVERDPVSESGVGWFRYAEFRDAVAVLLALELALAPAARGAERCAEHLFAIHAVGSLSRTLHAPEVGVASFRSEQLATDELALVPWFAPHGSFLVTISRDGVRVARCASDRKLRPRLESALVALHRARDSGPSDAPTARFDADALELSNWLFDSATLAAIAECDLVTIVGVDPVSGPPFDALPVFGTRLGLAKRVRWLPSARLAAGLRASAHDPAPRKGSVLVLSSGRTGTPGEPLGLTAKELLALTPQPATQRTLLRGPEATLEALASAPLDRAATLTLFAHGARAHTGSARMAIALTPAGDDGLLTSERVRALRVPPLVVLAVCAAVSDEARIGDDGVHHLGGAFLRSGARSLLSSPAELPLGPTVALVAEFERGLRAGLLPSAALRAARQEVVRSRGRSDPHEFATLLLVGLDANPFFPPSVGPASRSSSTGR